MKRHASWVSVVALVLIVVGVVTLAAPPPAQAFDPQLALALASAAGAITMITVYLIVSNSREKDRATSMNGIYTCREPESSGPMGCAGSARPVPGAAAIAEGPMGAEMHAAGRATPMPTEGPMVSFGPMPTAADAALQSAASPMIADSRSAIRTEPLAGRSVACSGGQPAGPMGCDDATVSPSGRVAPAAGAFAPLPTPPTQPGQ
ncbi:MAG TPA: hypothetical protein VID28_06040 [Methylomirabilota bacterium]|jgi:hypothetical protein